MPEENRTEIENIQPTETPEKTELAKDAVIAGVNKIQNQIMYLDSRAEGNQDSPSDLSLKALNPDDPQYSTIISNRFEIVDDGASLKPLAPGELRPKYDFSLPTIRKEDDVTSDFYQKVVDAWNSLPPKEQQLLKSAGVIVICKDTVEGPSGTPAQFFHATDSSPPIIQIGTKAIGKFEHSGLLYPNQDAAGSLKHEVGHALYDILKISSRADFSKIFKQELSSIPKNYHGDSQIDNPSHVFAECYARIRGRLSARVESLKEYFPETLRYVEKEFEP